MPYVVRGEKIVTNDRCLVCGRKSRLVLCVVCSHNVKKRNRAKDGYGKFLDENPPEKGGCIEYPRRSQENELEKILDELFGKGDAYGLGHNIIPDKAIAVAKSAIEKWAKEKYGKR